MSATASRYHGTLGAVPLPVTPSYLVTLGDSETLLYTAHNPRPEADAKEEYATTLIDACAKNNPIEHITTLIARDNIFALDKFRQSALYHAASKLNLAAVKLLLKAGGTPDAQNLLVLFVAENLREVHFDSKRTHGITSQSLARIAEALAQVYSFEDVDLDSLLMAKPALPRYENLKSIKNNPLHFLRAPLQGIYKARIAEVSEILFNHINAITRNNFPLQVSSIIASYAGLYSPQFSTAFTVPYVQKIGRYVAKSDTDIIALPCDGLKDN